MRIDRRPAGGVIEKLDRHAIGEGDRLQVLEFSIAVQKERPREGAGRFEFILDDYCTVSDTPHG